MSTTVVRGTTAAAIRPTTTATTATAQKICPPQIFVLPPNMFVSSLGSGNNNSNKMFVSSLSNNNNGVRTLMSVGNSFQKRQVQIMSRPAEKIMRPLNLKRPMVASPSLDSGSSDDDDDVKDGLMTGEERRVRKRANLDHLSSEEKMMRRKLKNRVAAQNARDKKRVKMEEMEVTIQQLEKQNQALLKTNETLEAENRLLVAENAKLRNANIMTFSPFNSDLMVKVKEEEDEISLPFSPESLPVTPSHTISDVEEDSDSTFVSAMNNSNFNIITDAGHNSNNSNNLRSPVVSRFRGPAERTESSSGSRPEEDDNPVHVAVPLGLAHLDPSAWTVACDVIAPAEAVVVQDGVDGGEMSVDVDGGFDDPFAGIQLAPEEEKPLVGSTPPVSACQDLIKSAKTCKISPEVLITTITTNGISNTLTTTFPATTTTTTPIVDEQSSEQLLDKYLRELQQQQVLTIEDQWDESFEDLFPDLV